MQEALEAVAWYYSGNTDAFVALQNTTEQTTKVTLTMFVAGQAVSLAKRHLKPQQVLTIKLPSPASLGYGSDTQSAGVRVKYSGDPGTIVAQGWMMDPGIGFSIPFAFHYPSNCNCSGDTQHLYGAGIMIGAAMMTTTASSNVGPTFSPYFTARNVSDKPLSITPIFTYVAQDHTEKVSLPLLTLNAQVSAVVNLRKYQEDGAIPMWVMGGNIDLQYKGESGALVAEMASVDQNGTFVSPVPLICNGNRALHMSFWRTDGDWHSSVTLQNIATEENDIEITISYPGGTYLLEKRIPAGEATMVSINELQQLQTPDREGRRIPADATFGGLNIWSRNVNDGLVINAMTMNPVTKTCGSCGGTGYVNWYALTDSYGCTSGFQTYAVAQSVNLMMSIHWTTSNCSYENPQLNSSSNTGVVNMSLLAVGPGSTSLQATSYQSYPTNISCSSYYRLTSTSGVSVIPSVSKIQYQQSGGTFVDITGTLYVLKGTAVTFKAIPNPSSASWPSGKPIWGGTSGASGTGATTSRTFSTVSSSTSDFKTVTATSGNILTVNVIVFDLTGVLTPEDNFSGRSTVRFGLREDIDLTFTVTPSVTAGQMGGLTWTLVSGDGTLPGTSNGISTYTAPAGAASATLKLNINSGPSGNLGPSYPIAVVEPSGAYMIEKPNTGLRHTINKLGVGFLGQAFLTPTDVSFSKLGFSEGTANASASGFFASLNNSVHNANGPFQITSCNIVTGCIAFEDLVDTNDWDPPFAIGSFTWVIPWRYVYGIAPTYVPFTSATHYQTAEASGRATIQKGGAGPFAKNASDATSSY